MKFFFAHKWISLIQIKNAAGKENDGDARKPEEEGSKNCDGCSSSSATAEEAKVEAEPKEDPDPAAVPPPEKAARIEVEVEEGLEANAPERKKIDWNDKLLLAPLTTVGNLPFR